MGRHWLTSRHPYDIEIGRLVAFPNLMSLLVSAERFSLLDLGDDALELEFAFLRMTGGHNNSVNYRQALDRLGAARDIGGVFAHQPDIATGHRRLNLSRAEGVDHISRAHWVGDTVVGHCNLTKTMEGQGLPRLLGIS
ncbi:hypothetical protein PAXINDRAFT_14669 [Paxillus involutus ATCC 200175]|uniref:Uncharacterized protein n=1 Tax=Paxillus involutus ATCC 200175 TaxID=664439 RepID=A0A0C9TPH5_PAXIN|nr:hypothetical protein PAXINDRAFT_14669 [Paxillus involutus ATCC 200175]